MGIVNIFIKPTRVQTLNYAYVNRLVFLCFLLTAKKRKSQMRFLGLYIKVSSNGLSGDAYDRFLQWTKNDVLL